VTDFLDVFGKLMSEKDRPSLLPPKNKNKPKEKPKKPQVTLY
jgi:hypothetical protein